MDTGAWLATVHRVSKSQTRLKRLSMHTVVFLHTRVWVDSSHPPVRSLGFVAHTCYSPSVSDVKRGGEMGKVHVVIVYMCEANEF